MSNSFDIILCIFDDIIRSKELSFAVKRRDVHARTPHTRVQINDNDFPPRMQGLNDTPPNSGAHDRSSHMQGGLHTLHIQLGGGRRAERGRTGRRAIRRRSPSSGAWWAATDAGIRARHATTYMTAPGYIVFSTNSHFSRVTNHQLAAHAAAYYCYS